MVPLKAPFNPTPLYVPLLILVVLILLVVPALPHGEFEVMGEFPVVTRAHRALTQTQNAVHPASHEAVSVQSGALVAAGG